MAAPFNVLHVKHLYLHINVNLSLYILAEVHIYAQIYICKCSESSTLIGTDILSSNFPLVAKSNWSPSVCKEHHQDAKLETNKSLFVFILLILLVKSLRRDNSILVVATTVYLT